MKLTTKILLGIFTTFALHAGAVQKTYSVHESGAEETPATGLIFPSNWEDLAPFHSPLVDEALPEIFDLRLRDGVTPVKNQGRCGSCWAFGTVAVLESLIRRTTGKIVDISEQQLVSCSPRYGSCGGGFFALGFYLAKGAAHTSEYPYLGRNAFCRSAPAHEKIASWSYVGQKGRTPTTEEIKQAIFDHGVVAATVSASRDFRNYKSGIFNDCRMTQTNHIVAIVGWNDAEKSWIMKNSWGEKWGEKGYMRIRYTDSRGNKCNRVGETVVYATLHAPIPNPILDSAGGMAGKSAGKLVYSRQLH